MKILFVCLAIIIILAMLLACRKGSETVAKGPVSSWKIGESWSIGHGTKLGKPIFTRFNLALKPIVGRPEYSHQLGIAIPLNDPTVDGLPTSDEAKQLNEIEDEIERRFLVGNESLFAGVITSSGMREFVLYTTNPEAALTKAEALARHFQHHKIQFVIHEDPNWENFKKFAAGT